jgi:hypothetical protein
VIDDIDAAQEWLDSWTAGVTGQAGRAAELSRRVAALTGFAENPDRSITVTVGSSGQVENVEFDDRVRLLDGAELSRRLMSTIRKAQADLSARVANEVRDTVGVDTETGRAVVNSFALRFPADAEQPADGDRDGR